MWPLIKIGASKLDMPNLLPSTLWHKTGRVEAMGSEVRILYLLSFSVLRIVGELSSFWRRRTRKK